ncbi:hypothetical protein A1O1_06822 [Capronia coronata CBS 617.96]|uniref:Uncharacterized protein n=1 Tax=Capronia coronata CBS 617.96 TaxID=1182541 RepID=W9XSJ1_9EURO|nr:uncharacterized protein A1O1_06822 [Capronia coronata CBS 617.96]EXJ83203.1 hypothetical protein A1O1_06822 [Capronia coronata CBS 617.96]
MPLHIDPRRGDDLHGRATDSPPEQMPPHPDQQLPPIQRNEEMQRTQAHEQMPPGTGHSPHPTSSTSIFSSTHSPIQTQSSSRTLPSPPGAQFPWVGSSSSAPYSPTPMQTAQKSHLQDLQHQISTKTLALQTLQREHDQLLAAFSRSHVRCTALEKKSQVSDHEINTLTEDKLRLQQQVDALEDQVEELSKAREEIQMQSSADMAQWRQIMAMSSQLQLKGSEETRQYKADREAWDRERISLQKRVEALESAKGVLPDRTVLSDSTTPVSNDAVLTSDSLELLRDEILKVRRRCFELESLLQELAGETDQIDTAISTLERFRKALAGRKRRLEDS